ncbi:biotin--[acetyl-CoA-carboxylase] ligase [Bacillus marinisedimentorum]|uniref:biotin--[acetyl-CoA-carboxylase] ligase n=1 Tax=Bacillus marinisedimentorum TaxID=1821260 RepID=UPI0008733275|nr:biotin--[acetyl-CoA-carboxylase] ligase [Bacillus marinisedimentorum]
MQPAVKETLLNMFADRPGQFLSGQQISEALGCSRTAVWKYIEDLRKEGFRLEAVPRKGYRITALPETLSGSAIRFGLKTAWFGGTVEVHDALPSTQKTAHIRSNEGAAEGTVIAAEKQTEGRGRLNRSWDSIAGKGIWMSIILRPDIPPRQAPQLTLLAAAAVRTGIQKVTGLTSDIKWPNDLLINGRKVAGILTELQADPDRVQAVIIGIGLNVNHDLADFPAHLQDKASSLAAEGGVHFNRNAVIAGILEELESLYFKYLKEGFAPVKQAWEEGAVSIGRKITATTVTSTLTGYAVGITGDGVLLLKDEEGAIHQIYSADIEIVPR